MPSTCILRGCPIRKQMVNGTDSRSMATRPGNLHKRTNAAVTQLLHDRHSRHWAGAGMNDTLRDQHRPWTIRAWYGDRSPLPRIHPWMSQTAADQLERWAHPTEAGLTRREAQEVPGTAPGCVSRIASHPGISPVSSSLGALPAPPSTVMLHRRMQQCLLPMSTAVAPLSFCLSFWHLGLSA